MKRTIIASFSVIAICLMASTADARNSSGKFRLHLDSHMLEVATGETRNRVGDGTPGYGGVEVGIGMDKAGIGFGFAPGSGLVFGGRITLGQETSSWHPGYSGEWFVWSLLPYIEYIWLSGVVRPFIKGQAGIEGQKDGPRSFFGFPFGVGGGIHVFPTDQVSIDIGGDLVFRFGGGDWHRPSDTDDRFRHWRFSFAILLGISAWL